MFRLSRSAIVKYRSLIQKEMLRVEGERPLFSLLRIITISFQQRSDKVKTNT